MNSTHGKAKANCEGVVTNVFETVDVITLIKGANYDELNLNVGEALQKRSEVRIRVLRQWLWPLANIGLGFSRHLYVFN